jgi:hypothetical protein
MKVLMDKGLKGSELLKEIENKKKDLRLKIDDWINELREVRSNKEIH